MTPSVAQGFFFSLQHFAARELIPMDVHFENSKQHVAFDYAQRLSNGINQASPMVLSALDALSGTPGASWELCPELNVSVCAASSAASSSGVALAVVAYNALATTRRGELLRIPVATPPSSATDANTGSALEFQVVESSWSPAAGALPYTVFVACPDVAPLAAATVLLHFDSSPQTQHVSPATEIKLGSGRGSSFEISSGLISLTFSNATGALMAAAYSGTGGDDPAVSISMSQSFGYYLSYDSGVENLELGDCDPDTWKGCPDLSLLPIEDTAPPTHGRSHHGDVLDKLIKLRKLSPEEKLEKGRTLVRFLKKKAAMKPSHLHQGFGRGTALAKAFREASGSEQCDAVADSVNLRA